MLAINNGNHPFSYQSPMPAAAGTPGHENWRHPCLSWIPAFAGEYWGIARAWMAGFVGRPRRPGWGQAPALRTSFWATGCRWSDR